MSLPQNLDIHVAPISLRHNYNKIGNLQKMKTSSNKER